MDARPISDLLRELREEQGQSLRQAARALEVNPAYLSRVERGEKPASAEMLNRASQYYDIPEEILALSRGLVPADIIRTLQHHPEVIEELRERYAS